MKNTILGFCMKLITDKKNYSEEQNDIIRYGLEAIYLTITKMIVIFGVAFLLGIIKEVFMLLVTYNIIRSQSFGIHASKSSYCLISSLIVFIGGALFCKYVVIPKIFMIFMSLIGNVFIFLYSPADTFKRPLVNAKKRIRFKIISSMLGIIYTILIITSNDFRVANYLLVGMFIAVIMILPITYRIFKMPYNNYKNYEYGV